MEQQRVPVVPYKDRADSKKTQVAEMFDQISPKYDLLNHTLSLGIDIFWRKKAIKRLRPYHPELMLDVATGTGDFAFEAMRLQPDKIIGLDISAGMLEVGRQKIRKKKLTEQIEFVQGDSENMAFESNKFDAITVGFGVRNFENLRKGLAEMHRVLKPGGVVAILEFAQPERFPVKQLYQLYFRYMLPVIGKWVSRDQAAYTYLPESVHAFPYGAEFITILQEIGYKKATCELLSFGISALYIAEK